MADGGVKEETNTRERRIWGLIFNLILKRDIRHTMSVAYLLRRNSGQEGFVLAHDSRIWHGKEARLHVDNLVAI